MRARLSSLVVSLVLVASPVGAQTPVPSKRIVATRTMTAPRIDGRLDREEWDSASFVSDFTQKEPSEGSAPSEPTQIAVRFDDHAIYIGARLHRRDPVSIHRAVTRRDDVGNTERIIVALDTYHDHRTAYSFAVTAAGGIADYYHSSDDEFDRDYSFDPVWQAETSIDATGWSVEMRIPFSQLRFNDVDQQVWGINIDRWIPDLNEDLYWVMIPKNENGWASRFGELVGLEGIRPSLRLELLPYVAAQAHLLDAGTPAGPFDETFGGRAGLDAKVGLGPNLTLDATVNPDFGQVEADPAQVNLSDFESTFDERRPFFVEGAQLLRGGGATYFYSRRIGAPPRGRVIGDYIDVPDNSTILAAAKLTGRLPSGLSVGALAAVTERELAQAFDAGDSVRRVIEVEPLTGFGVVRLQQEFGQSQSTIGATATLVRRDVEPGSDLGATLTSNAVTGGIDYALRFDGGAWQLAGYAGGSHVRGDSLAILRLQRSSARYFGRPDADYVEIDPTRRSLTGYVVSANLEKNSGRWRGFIGSQAESPELELNDLGQLSTSDDIDSWAGLNYHENEPGRHLRNFRLGLSSEMGWNYGGVNTYHSLGATAGATLLSFWSVEAWGGINLPAFTDGLSRGGPLMGTAFGGYGGAYVGSPWTGKVRGSMSAGVSANALGGWSLEIDPSITAEIGEQWRVTFSPHFSRSLTPRQYVATLEGGSARTYDRRYVFARIDQTYLSAQLRVGYVISPHLSLDLYAEPFAGSGRYHDYGELSEPGATDIRRYEASGGTTERVHPYTVVINDAGERFEVSAGDFTYLSFRSNLVIRWEWLPGSTAYFVWQRGAEAAQPVAEGLRPRHIADAIRARGDQVFALKIAYWLPVD